jgi:murein L,D-transpeptidase YafK
MTLIRKIGRFVPYGVAAGGALALSACNDSGLSQRSLQPIPPETLALMEQAGVTKEAPTLIRSYKKESEFEIWKQRPDGRYVYLKTFPMCRWSGQLGPKVREGDRQAPEGFYSITPGQMNPNSSYYLSFNVGYPNAYDRALGHGGGSIMVHGACSSAGCFSMTDHQISEIYAILRTSFNNGQRAIQMQSYPFKMTAENLAKHRLDPNIGFWKQLKNGSDHFEAAWREPTVGVCGRHYVFDAAPAAGHSLDAAAPCPALRQDPQIESLVAEKAAKDDAKIAELVAAGVKPVRVVYQDGGQHPAFAARIAEVSRPDALAAPPSEFVIEEKPAKGPVKLAAKSPVVAMAAAKAAAVPAAETAAQQPATAAAPAAETGLESTRLAALAAGAGAVGGWLGLRKEAEAAPAAAPVSEIAKTEPASAQPGPAAVKPPAPPRRAELKKPQASIGTKKPEASIEKAKTPRAEAAPAHILPAIATASLRDNASAAPAPARR